MEIDIEALFRLLGAKEYELYQLRVQLAQLKTTTKTTVRAAVEPPPQNE